MRGLHVILSLFSTGTSSRSFAKGIEMWKEETVLNVSCLIKGRKDVYQEDTVFLFT